MCIAKIAFNALFRPSKHLFTPKTPFAEKVMGPNFKHLYDTSSAASRLVKNAEDTTTSAYPYIVVKLLCGEQNVVFE